MAPEVIQESRYDGKVDVWALGVSAIEMAEGLPPRSNVHPMRVLFMISREPAPMLEDKEKWSLVFHDFVAKCLTKEPRIRPTANTLLQHKFIEKCKGTASSMLPQIEKARVIKTEMTAHVPKYPQEQGTTSSGGQYSSWEKGQTVKMHETFGGTMLVRDTLPKSFNGASPFAESGGTDRGQSPVGLKFNDGGESEKAAPDGTVSASLQVTPRSSSFSESLYSESVLRGGGQEADLSWSQIPAGGQSGGDTMQVKGGLNLTPLETPTQASSPTPLPSPLTQKAKEMQSTLPRRSPGAETSTGPGTPLAGGSGRHGFALQDKLLSVYAAGNTVPIPFLRATDVSPIALIYDDISGDGQPDHSGTVALEAIQELYSGKGLGDGQIRRGRKVSNNEMPLPPSVYQRLATSTTLPNLARALAYHKRCYEEMPLQGWQAAQEQQIIHNLSDTLRTILRL
jgi:hypothetical protein